MTEKGLLAVSFGTTFPEARERSVRAVEADLQAGFPDRALREAFTSGVVRRRIREAEGLLIPDTAQALRQMAREGLSDILVQPTHIISGLEYRKVLQEAAQVQEERQDIRIRTGRALLEEERDYPEAAEAAMNFLQDSLQLSCRDLQEFSAAVVWMGHGSEHAANACYGKMQEQFRRLGYENVYVPTVEGLPRIEEALRQMQADCHAKGRGWYRSVVLAPFMLVAGDHARNDMASDSPDSWKRILEREGCEVRCLLRGLGECAGIRRMILRHAKEAMIELGPAS